jgi:hypothetical protein
MLSRRISRSRCLNMLGQQIVQGGRSGADGAALTAVELGPGQDVAALLQGSDGFAANCGSFTPFSSQGHAIEFDPVCRRRARSSSAGIGASAACPIWVFPMTPEGPLRIPLREGSPLVGSREPLPPHTGRLHPDRRTNPPATLGTPASASRWRRTTSLSAASSTACNTEISSPFVQSPDRGHRRCWALRGTH